eukprot:1896722-Prymnesium_polylepis.1
MERSSETWAQEGSHHLLFEQGTGATWQQLPRMATDNLTGILLLILTGMSPKISFGIFSIPHGNYRGNFDESLSSTDRSSFKVGLVQGWGGLAYQHIR